jgi:carboxymethylenebutenolidase
VTLGAAPTIDAESPVENPAALLAPPYQEVPARFQIVGAGPAWAGGNEARLARFVFLLPLLAIAAQPARAAVRTMTVQYRSGGETVSGYLAVPESAGRHPAVIVIHEWWGLVDWVKEQARLLAGQGYVALAVDLYRGRSTADPEVARELARALAEDHAVRDLRAAFDYLASRPDVDPNRIGSIGWCMGGGYSMRLAVAEPRLAACVVNYGVLPTDPARIQQIHAPVLGNFGGLDRGIPPEVVNAFVRAMRAAGKSIDVKIYPDAGHAFENPNNERGYRPADARDAWARVFNFFRESLSAPRKPSVRRRVRKTAQ